MVKETNSIVKRWDAVNSTITILCYILFLAFINFNLGTTAGYVIACVLLLGLVSNLCTWMVFRKYIEEVRVLKIWKWRVLVNILFCAAGIFLIVKEMITRVS